MTPTRRLLVMAVLALLLAATAAVIIARQGPLRERGAEAHLPRPIEARLAHPDAAAHRPYGPRPSASGSAPALASGSAAPSASAPGGSAAQAASAASAASARIARLQNQGDKQALA